MAKILLVEDNEMNRDMLPRRLERKDFEVLIATYGQAAVWLFGSGLGLLGWIKRRSV